MKKIKGVSCIIPAYNSSSFLERCIKSIWLSGMEDIEVIIVDDGSTDDTNQTATHIVQKYRKEGREILLVSQKNQGVSVARNTGMTMASKDWIMFVDADDMLLPNWANHVKVTHLEEFEMVCFSFRQVSSPFSHITYVNEYPIIDESLIQGSKREEYMRQTLGFRKVLRTSIPLRNACAKIFRRKILAKAKLNFPAGVKNGEDLLFMLSCYSVMNKIGICQIPIYDYIVNEGSLTQRFKPDIKEITDKFFEFLKPVVEKYPFLRTGYIASIANNYFIEMGSFLFHKSNTWSVKDKKVYYLSRLPFYESSIKDAKLPHNSLFNSLICTFLKLGLKTVTFYLWILRSIIRDILK